MTDDLLNEENLSEDERKNYHTTQAERLLNAVKDLSLFHDQNKDAFVFLDNEVVLLRSKKFRQWLSYRLYKAESKAPNSDALNQAITVMEGKALYEGEYTTLHNRIAKEDNVFWYDLGKGRSIKITPNGWDIATSPILFRRYEHQAIQVEPVSGGDPWDVFKFLNVDDEHKLLVLIYVISCFIPDIPHPIFHPHGAQGAGKTTLCKIIKRICDPSTIETIITPRDVAQLVQVIAHHHVCLFDNVSGLPPWMSDILAQACTGGGFSKRQLYSDDEDIIYQVKRCIGINGINLLISKPDLMDRSILLQLERIMPDRRIEEEQLWKDFEAKRPQILGGIFDVLSQAMARYPDIQLKNLPRMADFTKWGYAITEALGTDGNQFLNAYQGNIERQNEEVIQGNTLAQAVFQLMANSEVWDGMMKEAWEALYDIADPKPNDPTFPKSERVLRRHLERIKTNLMDSGIIFTIGKRVTDGVPISFQKIRDFGSFSTLSTEPNKINVLQDVNDMKINVEVSNNYIGST